MRSVGIVLVIAGCGGDKAVPPRQPAPEVVIVVPDARPATGDAPEPFEPPGTGRTVVTTTSITILDPIKFVGATARLDPSSNPILDAIAATLTGNPDIRVLEVHCFGSEAPARHQQQLGHQRALAIAGYLAYRGVAPARLRAVGVAGPPPAPEIRVELVIIRD
jgi:outer membrane protein OmpA-like peptidoglycan-associated protein